MGISLVAQTEDMLRVVATAARVCYSGLPVDELLSRFSDEDNEKLIKKVVGMGHLSVVEHGVMTFSVPSSFKEELFKVMMEKPFLKITEKEDGFFVTLNLRTIVELINEMPELGFSKELRKFVPDFLKDVIK
ncbi:Thymidylate synthase complementing protein [Desulfurobacterium pacificum]|uniref:Thymidylate synthase complementing protein n=1 Tax=Desulfurobacterium pacificum TaxID=240166 RepID=A0ABY1NN05_9BACT|nr:FAD-dependent thymidylate synthase [Desulfurobacterium pacificum]SMP13948.1 Thymidylate synthase complementing protein [Desulfurobacterium pacificum]